VTASFVLQAITDKPDFPQQIATYVWIIDFPVDFAYHRKIYTFVRIRWKCVGADLIAGGRLRLFLAQSYYFETEPAEKLKHFFNDFRIRCSAPYITICFALITNMAQLCGFI